MILSALTLLIVAQWIPQPMPVPDDFPPGNRYAEVLAAPPESDLFRFPPRSVCTTARHLNTAFRKNLEAERELWPACWQPVFDAALSDAAELYAAWDKLDDCHAFYGPVWWRQRLRPAELRTLIGPDAYAAGEMPPALPSWWARELR